jgi:hypothetical protein
VLRFLGRNAVDRRAVIAYAGTEDGLTYGRGTTTPKIPPLVAGLLLVTPSLHAERRRNANRVASGRHSAPAS